MSSAKLSTRTNIGGSLKAGDKQVAMVTKSHRLRLLNIPFFLRWDRGSERMIPILDVTRIVQVSIFFLAFLILFALSRVSTAETNRA